MSGRQTVSMDQEPRTIAAVAAATSVVVMRGWPYDGQVPRKRTDDKLVESDDLDVIDALTGVLGVEGESFYWMQWPDLSIVLLADRTVVAVVAFLLLPASGPVWARSDLWGGDRRLADELRLWSWLEAVGIETTVWRRA